MKDFEPSVFQKETFDRIKAEQKVPPLIWPRRGTTYVGVDMAEAGVDKTVIAQSQIGKDGKVYIFYDEYADWPNYKWYRNPIKWWKWQRLMKRLEKQMEKYTWKN